MNRTDTLKSLETVLESFLERAVSLKEERLSVLTGINRLDDIARRCAAGIDLTEEVGGWLAEHGRWISEPILRQGDHDRIGQILGAIKEELKRTPEETPARNKIVREIERWDESVRSRGTKLVLKRGPETAETSEETSISLFGKTLARINDLFADLSGSRAHVLTVLDDTLKAASRPENKEALILAATMVYYLKQNGYKVEPYVKRLKEAELLQRGAHA